MKIRKNGSLLPFDIAYDPQLAPMIRRNLTLNVLIKATLTLKRETASSKAIWTVFRKHTLCQTPEVYHLVSTRCEEPDIHRIRIGAIVYLSFVLSVCPSFFPLSIMVINAVDMILSNLMQTSWKCKRAHISALWILVFISRDMARQMSVKWQQFYATVWRFEKFCFAKYRGLENWWYFKESEKYSYTHADG